MGCLLRVTSRLLSLCTHHMLLFISRDRLLSCQLSTTWLCLCRCTAALHVLDTAYQFYSWG